MRWFASSGGNDILSQMAEGWSFHQTKAAAILKSTIKPREQGTEEHTHWKTTEWGWN